MSITKLLMGLTVAYSGLIYIAPMFMMITKTPGPQSWTVPHAVYDDLLAASPFEPIGNNDPAEHIVRESEWDSLITRVDLLEAINWNKQAMIDSLFGEIKLMQRYDCEAEWQDEDGKWFHAQRLRFYSNGDIKAIYVIPETNE